MQVFCGDASATEALGERLAPLLRCGDVITLSAPLGGGKTTLVRGLARGLGVAESEVSSPTFVLMQIYPGRLPIYHFDAYRLESTADLHPIGAEDYFWGDGVSLIEWPEVALPLLPDDRLEISIAYCQEGRQIALQPQGNWTMRLQALGDAHV